MSVFPYVVGGLLGCVPVYFEAESRLAGMVGPKLAAASPAIGVLASGILITLLGMDVNKARIKYKISWPTLYAVGDSQEAHLFNCVQRAHQHYLESLPMIYSHLYLASRSFPVLSTLSLLLFLLGRYVSARGYQSGDVQQKDKGNFGAPGVILLLGLAVHATVKMLI